MRNRNSSTTPDQKSRPSRKRTLSAAIGTVALLAGTACGSGGGGDGSGGEQEVTLSYWTSATERAVKEATIEIVDQFEQDNPGIKVDAQFLPFNPNPPSSVGKCLS